MSTGMSTAPSHGWAALAQHVAGARARFQAQARDARATQRALLQAILTRHAGSAFGQRHGFAHIASLRDFQQAVAPAGYASLAPEIEMMAGGDVGRLVNEPVVAFERTGGSSGGPKLIPFTASGLALLRDGLFAWLDDLLQRHPGVMQGTSYWSISPATRAPERTVSGMAIGLPSDAAYLGDAGAHLATVLSVPPAVGALTELTAWRRATLAHLLADEHLAMVSVWSPTFWLELCRHAVLLKDDLLAQGGAASEARVTHGLTPERAARVHAALSATPPDWPSVWPHLALISCWTQASSASWAQALAAQFPYAALQGKGLLATEGMVSVPISDDDGDPVAAIGASVLEFQDDAGRAHACDEVVVGGEYQVLLTTSAGLYRYRLGDRVRVTGFWQGAPRLQLLGRGDSSSDLCGEKLTEAFVLRALRDVGLLDGAHPLRLVPRTRPVAHYALRLGWACDAAQAAVWAARADAALRANPQYAHARDLGQLAPIVPQSVPDLRAQLQRLSLSRGQRLGDAKPAVLGHVDEDIPATATP